MASLVAEHGLNFNSVSRAIRNLIHLFSLTSLKNRHCIEHVSAQATNSPRTKSQRILFCQTGGMGELSGTLQGLGLSHQHTTQGRPVPSQ